MTKKQLKWLIKEIVQQINETFDFIPRTPKLALSINRFSLTSWEYRPLLELISQANAKFNLGIKDLHRWQDNNGQGLQTQEECNKLANALESLIGKQPYNRPVRGRNLPKTVPGIKPGTHLKPGEEPYQTNVGTIQKFIKFLRTCGGFQIW
jgi:hypothetical protein